MTDPVQPIEVRSQPKRSREEARPEGAPRVLVLVEDLGGGTGNHLCELLARWRRQGWEITLVTPVPPLVQKLPAGVDLRVSGTRKWYDRFPLTQVRRLLEIRRLVRAVKPDVVHTYFFWSIIYGRLLKLIGEVPTLVENREDLGFSWGPIAYAALRFTRNIPDRIICVAEAVRRVVLERERAPRDRTIVVRNGLSTAVLPSPDARAAARAQFGFSDDQVVVGMVANLPRAVKGGGRLLDAVRRIVSLAPHARFLLIGVGTDPETLKPELGTRGIAQFVVGAGYRGDVDVCYSAMDISVLTSSSEGLSITLLESMRHRLPVVATDVGGNSEATVDGVTGFLVPVDDPSAFVERVAELSHDSERRRGMGEAGYRRVVEQFSIDDVARRYLAVYRELLSVRDGAYSAQSATLSALGKRA
jgi:glycosyltransferase involved in cell wall biosynthesis